MILFDQCLSDFNFSRTYKRKLAANIILGKAIIGINLSCHKAICKYLHPKGLTSKTMWYNYVEACLFFRAVLDATGKSRVEGHRHPLKKMEQGQCSPKGFIEEYASRQ